MPPSAPTVRPATGADLHLVAENFRRMWLDLGTDPALLRDDWRDVAADFIARAQDERRFRAFLAEIDGDVVGSAACELWRVPYPVLFVPGERVAGYVWGVYVDPAQRRRGIATALTDACVGYLRGLGCARVLLHASPMGEPVYAAMGFHPTNERALDL